jgi:serine protease Do
MRKHITLAVIALALSGCANPNGGPPSSGYSVFFTQSDHLKDLVAKKLYDGAVKLYDEQEAYFLANEAKVGPLLEQAATGYNETWQPKIDEAIAKVSAISWPTSRDKWAETKNALAFASTVLNGYGEGKLVTGARRAEGIGALRQIMSDVTQRVRADAPNRMRDENLDSGRNFFVDYPVTLTSPGLLAARMRASFDAKADEERLFKIVKTYSVQISSDKSAKEETSREVDEIFRQKAKSGSIQQIVAFYKRTLGASIAPKTIPITVAFHAAPTDGAPFPVTVERDIPFEWKQAGSLSGPHDADFVMAMGPSRIVLDRKVGNYAQVNSTYLAGYQTLPNPDYQTALLNMQRAQQVMANARTQQLTAAQDMTCDAYGCRQNPWSQLGASIGMIGAQKTFSDAQAQIQSTPQTIQKAVYQPYAFETAVISTSKSTETIVFVGRPKLGMAETYSKAFDQNRDFKLAYKVHEKDEGSGKSSSFSSEATVEAWEKQTVSASLVALFSEGVEKKGVPWQQASTAFDRKAYASNVTRPKSHDGRKDGGPSGTTDRRFGSVVVIRTADSIGSGFFVTPDVILTNEHVVKGQSYITMKTYDGADINGKVVGSDRRRDLALIKASSTGTPVKFAMKEINVGVQVEVIGHPQGLQYTLTRGIVSQLRTMPPASGVGSGLISYVQLDASISPGNSGGPVYQDGSVIGVATWKVAAKASENLNFAVHRDEVASFLRENGISP